MRLIDIPPYQGTLNYTPTEGHWMLRELIANVEKKGQLEGVEIDIDEGYPSDHSSTDLRDEELFANLTAGFLKRVRYYSEMGKYDAIISSCGMDIGFSAARMISKIPVAYSIHSAVHVASLIGDRFSIISTTDPQSMIPRHSVQLYGLSHKLVSIRPIFRSCNYVAAFVRNYKKEERIKFPEVKKLVDEMVANCITAIEKDRVDSLILGEPWVQCFEDEIRQELNKAGYEEIQLIPELSAAVEMAKAMVNMKLTQAPRAYPGDSLKAKPEFR